MALRIKLRTNQFAETLLQLASASCPGAFCLARSAISPEEDGCPDVTGYLRTYSSPKAFDQAEERSQKLWEEFSQKCLQMVQSRADEAKAAGVNAEFYQLPGSPGLTICKVAQNWGADLIVIGRRGHLSKFEELVLGSVSNYVLHHASCAVFVVPRFG